MLEFISTQILGMKWLSDLISILLDKIGLDLNTKMGASVHFFIYDMVKIIIILSVIMFFISYIQSYFPPKRTKEILGKYKGIKANFMGALLGTITPFCSCSSIPIFLGFNKAGVPIGVSFSFLISSPLVDAGAIVILMSTFGFKVAFVYVIVGIILAILGGMLIDKMKMEKYLEKTDEKEFDFEKENLTKVDRIKYAKDSTKNIIKSVFWYIVIGIGIGALIHNWVPQQFIENILGENNPFSVLLATIVGIPIYAEVLGTIPIAQALYAKGALIGTVMSFMMAVTTLSLPSLIMLRKAVKPKLLTLFVLIVTGGIIFIGYGFNFLF